MLAAAHDHKVIRNNRTKSIFSVADPGRGPGPPYFWSKLRPEGLTKTFWETGPPSKGPYPALTSPAQSFG